MTIVLPNVLSRHKPNIIMLSSGIHRPIKIESEPSPFSIFNWVLSVPHVPLAQTSTSVRSEPITVTTTPRAPTRPGASSAPVPRAGSATDSNAQVREAWWAQGSPSEAVSMNAVARRRSLVRLLGTKWRDCREDITNAHLEKLILLHFLQHQGFVTRWNTAMGSLQGVIYFDLITSSPGRPDRS